jgi:TetR/AcrR family transcriptional regulator, tetracycline repressor protein
MADRTKSAPPAGRVPRNTLSRPRIVDAAVALVDAEGLDGLTMPRLAEHLGVGTMSLYRHVAGKDDLLDAVGARLLAGVAVPDGAPDDWEGRVVGYLRSLRAQALRHPALARLPADRGLAVGPVFEQLEAVLSVLRTAGFSDLDAVRAFYSLLTYVFGYVLWELPRVHAQPVTGYLAAWTEALDGLDPDAYPTLTALRPELATSASDDQFEYGLDRLVASLRSRSRT